MTKTIIRKLNQGLIIRHATPDDTQPLAAFNKEIHADWDWVGIGIEDWTLDLISGKGPTFDIDDITIVEDTKTGEIVSTCCLISQTWSYEGIPFKVGRPELVATSEAYRRRGLVRQQFEILHEWSEARGELVQAITGIPYYYRQFGYEMTLSLDGGRSGYEVHVPKLKEDQSEPYTFRQATMDDLSFLMSTYELGCKRSLISTVWNEEIWRYELTGKRKHNINRRNIYIIENKGGVSVGFIGIPPIKWKALSVLTVYELTTGFSWSEVTPGVVRFLWRKGEELAKEQDQEQKQFGFWLGESHPAYDVLTSKLPRQHKPYAFYLRVPDLCAFIKNIKHVLENRLANSSFAQYSGEIKLCFYRSGLKLIFSKGQLKEVEELDFIPFESATACFPPLVFLHLLFGHRNMDELDYAFTDCSSKNTESKNLLNVLFPKKPSNVWSIS